MALPGGAPSTLQLARRRPPIVLRACYAVSGTELAYGPPRSLWTYRITKWGPPVQVSVLFVAVFGYFWRDSCYLCRFFCYHAGFWAVHGVFPAV
eukprot:3142740-Rhodomonas_salina.1